MAESHTCLRLAWLLAALLHLSGHGLQDLTQNSRRERQEGTGLKVKSPLMLRRLELLPSWGLQRAFPVSKRSVISLI